MRDFTVSAKPSIFKQKAPTRVLFLIQNARCKDILFTTRGDLISLPLWGRWREQSERRMRFRKLVSATSSVLLRNPPSPRGKGYECIRRSYVPSPSCFAIQPTGRGRRPRRMTQDTSSGMHQFSLGSRDLSRVLKHTKIKNKGSIEYSLMRGRNNADTNLF